MKLSEKLGIREPTEPTKPERIFSTKEKKKERLRDYPDLEEKLQALFDGVLDPTQWEQDFIDDLEEKWDQWGKEMFVSEKQAEIIERIYDEKA